MTARVVKVLEDGKLTLSIREKAYLQIQKDAEKIEKLLDSYEGSLPFNDKAAPEVITHETGMSKNEFKRAVGHMLKEGKIQITEKISAESENSRNEKYRYSERKLISGIGIFVAC